MHMISIQALPLVALAGVFAWPQQGGDSAKADGPQFAQPQRIQVGDDFLGEGRLYPSPVLRDMDGDGLPDIVIGDLFGKVTVAARLAGDAKMVRFEKDEAIKNRNGELLKFHNW